MPHSPEDKNGSTGVRRIRGQVEALERALEFMNLVWRILQQITAPCAASNGLMSEMLKLSER